MNTKKCLALTALVGMICLLAPVRADEPSGTGVNPDIALQQLKNGNQRFVAGNTIHAGGYVARRSELARSQKPIAVVVSCSDSRVPPETVFDQGLGDIFVVRSAGEVVDDIGIGSIEYAVEHLGAQLILVLGHERCGAVGAAVDRGEIHGHVAAVVKAIQPAVAETKGQPGDPVENAVRANALHIAKLLRASTPVLVGCVKAGKLKIVAARYDLDTGWVEILE
jgi:carbonic anhydrase